MTGASGTASLHLVKDEIAEALHQVQQSIKDYYTNESADTFEAILSNIHQIHGCLQIVELYGAALLVSEAETLLDALQREEIQDKESAYEYLLAAMLRLPVYLDLIDRGQEDRPLMLLPLINDLRTVRGESELSKSALFLPNLDTVENFTRQSSPTSCQDAEKELLVKLRRIYLVGLLGILKDNKLERSLAYLQQALTDLDALSGSKPLGQFWWIVRAVIEGLQDKGIDSDVALKILLGRVDREIKRFINDGISALDQAPPNPVRNKLLYYVAHSTSEGALVKEVKEAFALDQFLFHEEEDDASQTLNVPDPSVLKTVGGVLKEELAHIKEKLDGFMRQESHDVNKLSPLLEDLSKALETLKMLGLKEAHDFLAEKITILEKIIKEEVPLQDNYLLEVASSLLYVETSLDNMGAVLGFRRNGSNGNSFASHEQQIALDHVRQAEKTIIHEARVEMSQAKEKILAFSEEFDHNELKAMPDILNAINANLNVLGFDRPAKLLHECLSYIENKIIKESAKPPEMVMNHLADVISSIEYYLECKENNRQFDTVLDKAESSLSSLNKT